METLSVATRSRCEMRDITAQVRELVARGRQQGRRNGALLLFSPHTTCGLTINEGADPDVRRDMALISTMPKATATPTSRPPCTAPA